MANDIQIYKTGSWRTLRDKSIFKDGAWKKFGTGSGIYKDGKWHVLTSNESGGGNNGGGTTEEPKLETNTIKFRRMTYWNEKAQLYSVQFEISAQKDVESDLTIEATLGYKDFSNNQWTKKYSFSIKKGASTIEEKTIDENAKIAFIWIDSYTVKPDKDSKYQYNVTPLKPSMIGS